VPNPLGEAEAALDELQSLWGEKYPFVIKSWRSKWEHLSAYFKYPEDNRYQFLDILCIPGRRMELSLDGVSDIDLLGKERPGSKM
jgi:hypothetical protein